MGELSEEDLLTDMDGSAGTTSGTEDVAILCKPQTLGLVEQDADDVHGEWPVMLSGRLRHPSVGVALICVMS